MPRRVIGALAVAGAILAVGASAIWSQFDGVPAPPPPGLANGWVSPNGTGPCAFSATLITAPSASAACGADSLNTNYHAVPPGATIGFLCNNGQQYWPNVAQTGAAPSAGDQFTLNVDAAKVLGSAHVQFVGDGSGCKPPIGAKAILNYPNNDFQASSQCQVGSPNGGHCQDFLPSGPTLAVTPGSSGTLAAGTYYYRVGYVISNNALAGQPLPEAPAGPQSAAAVGANGSVAITWAASGAAPANVTYFVYRTSVNGGQGGLIATRTGTQLSFTDTGVTPGGQLAKLGYTITVASTAGFWLPASGTPYTIYPGASIFFALTCNQGGDATHFFGCRFDRQNSYTDTVVGDTMSPVNDAPGVGLGNGYAFRQGGLVVNAHDTTWDGFDLQGLVAFDPAMTVQNNLVDTKIEETGDGSLITRNVWTLNEDSLGQIRLDGCGTGTGCKVTYNDFPRVGTANCIGNSSCHYESSFWANNHKVLWQGNRCWGQQLYCIFMSRGSNFSNYGPITITDNYGAANGTWLVTGGGDGSGGGLNGMTIANNSIAGNAVDWGYTGGVGSSVTGVRVYNNIGIVLPCAPSATGHDGNGNPQAPGTLDFIADHNAEFGTGSPCGGAINTGGLQVDATNFRIATPSLVWASTIGPALDLINSTTPAEHAGSSVNCPSPDIYGTVRVVPCTLGAYEPPGASLTVNTTGSGTGTVTSTPAGISCPGTCSTTFAPGTSVKLASNAAMGSFANSWTNGCIATTPSCSLTLNSPATVGMSFSPNQTALASGYNTSTDSTGFARAWQLYVPSPLSTTTKHKLLVVFQGAGNPGMTAQTYTTDANWLTRGGDPNMEFLTLWGYAQTSGAFCATTTSPNCGPRAWNYPNHDEIWVREMIDTAIKGNNIDPRRVYTTGDSAGATMNSTMACGTGGVSSRIAAYAWTSGVGNSLTNPYPTGSIIDKWGNTCVTPNEPRSRISFFGDADPNFNPAFNNPPFQCSLQTNSNPPEPTAGLTLCFASWATMNTWWRLKMGGCPGSPTTANPAGGIYGTNRTDTWANCNNGTSDVMVQVLGGGHGYGGMDFANGLDLYGAQVGFLKQWSLP